MVSELPILRHMHNPRKEVLPPSPQNQGKKAPEDFSQAAVRIAEETTEKG
jgi:hypothetical protein